MLPPASRGLKSGRGTAQTVLRGAAALDRLDRSAGILHAAGGNIVQPLARLVDQQQVNAFALQSVVMVQPLRVDQRRSNGKGIPKTPGSASVRSRVSLEWSQWRRLVAVCGYHVAPETRIRRRKYGHLNISGRREERPDPTSGRRDATGRRRGLCRHSRFKDSTAGTRARSAPGASRASC